ncbi:MAG: CehA/McbA family metallohydrolase [Sedimentisphaerales bacterium]|nr:CehA/McbA family metallohydrolase [Sedimentisphaerales bacterium]
MKKTYLITIMIWLVFCFLNQNSMAAIRLESQIVDDATGEPLAARVALTNPDGKFIEIEGRHEHVQYVAKRWCYVNGTFAVTIPDSGATIEISRGFETRPLIEKISGKAKAGTVQKTFRLRRWIDMRQKGYVNGDIHAHLPVPEEARVQMLAEDLNAQVLYHVADSQFSYAINKCFTGKLDVCSSPGCEIYVGQEIREFQMGHLGLLNIKKLVPGYPDMGGSLEYWRSRPHWDLMRAMRATREQNGMVVWCHISSLPGAEFPVGIALGLVDAVELITWSDPTQLPNHWNPWLNSGFSMAEFPIMRSLDLYYQFLNAGFRLPIAAGTDKFGEEIPLGSNRVYARVDGQANFASWLEAVRAGKTFVTNGPILEFEADGQHAGDVVEFSGSKQIKARVTARSILPFTTLEIVANGETVGHKTIPNEKHPAVDGLYSMEVEAAVDISQSTWLAARVVEHPDLRSRILPRGLSVFAHTSPIYFLKDGKKVRQEASIAYLRKYVEGTIHWLGTNPQFATEEELRSAKQAAEQALQVYKNL